MIDYSPLNAPLDGARRPSIGQLNQIIHESRRSSWMPPQEFDPLRCRALTLYALAALVVIPLILGLLGSVKHPPSSLSSAKSLHVLVRHPDSKLLEILRMAHYNGADIRVLSCEALPDEKFQILVVSPDRIRSEGILKDGVEWVSLQ